MMRLPPAASRDIRSNARRRSHDLRHAAASFMLAEGVSTVMERTVTVLWSTLLSAHSKSGTQQEMSERFRI